MKQRVIMIHGVSTRSPHYAQELVEHLAELLKDIDHEITCLYMGDIFERDLEVIENEQKASPYFHVLKAHVERKWMGQFVGDFYQFENWKEYLLEQVDVLKSAGPVHIVANSWGSIFAVEELLPVINAVSLTFHGAPLDLYRLRTGPERYEFKVPTDNFFHPMDFIGGPIAHCSNATDHVITDAGPETGVDFIDVLQSVIEIHKSHAAGWHSKALAQCVATKVIAAAKSTQNKQGSDNHGGPIISIEGRDSVHTTRTDVAAN